ncbi:MAG: N-6 DNA methylase, partial [Candidatus Brocadiae bacterium]|nr:N-6 DNA methylase [Candidatus Brocadiia bacterium]
MATGFRQEVINVVLARLLQERGLVTAPEYIFDATLERGRKMVDVIVYYNGLRTAIEGEVADQPDAPGRALESARRRVEDGIAHIGVGVVYPESLRRVEFRELPRQLARCRLQIALVTEAGETGFAPGDVGYLETALRSAFERLVREDVVTKAVAILDAGVGGFASAVALRPGVMGRMIDRLGIRPLGGTGTAPATPRRPAPGEETAERAACRIGGLVVANAMIFQEVLSGSETSVRSLSEMPPDVDPVKAFIEHWTYILDSIDYYPIFHVARAVLRTTTAHREILMAVGSLADTARELVGMRAPMRHDLMGRVYHRLLSQAKYLGTYYTSIPAATLLLEMALRPDAWTTQWHDLAKLSKFRVADLACGTGTLLVAAAQALAENYIEASQGKGPGLDLAGLHRVMAEDVIYGYDVLPSAVHLTASTLALRAPQVTFGQMNLYSLPLGGKDRRLGSIEFLQSSSVNMHVDLFAGASATERLAPSGQSEPVPAALPRMDLCVMNPPFTRSVGGNLLFGSSPPQERRQMQAKLRKMLRDPKVLANSTAGLGSVFLAVAHAHIKPGGRLAVVLPKAVLSGVAWRPTRELLRTYYRMEYVICSHDPERWNFSESTDLSEVLLVAVKNDRKSRQDEGGRRVTAVNLWQNPTTPFEALAVARALRQGAAPDVEGGQGALEL